MKQISEESFETHIVDALTQGAGLGDEVATAPAAYDGEDLSAYRQRASQDYDRDLCLIPIDVITFIQATQVKEWKKLAEHHGDQVKEKFLKRLRREIESKGTLEVLRRGIKDRGCKFQLAYFRPHSGLNKDLARNYASNVFTVVRQLRYDAAGNELDLAIFLNGLPLFTAELKNNLTDQGVAEAVDQYRHDRSAQAPLFAFGRCLAHFAVDTQQVQVATHLSGASTRFLPFNRGYMKGAGNPPGEITGDGYRTAYLWNKIWAKDSVLNLIQHFIHRVQKEDPSGKGPGKQIQLFPRYHQLDTVRWLVHQSREYGAGRNYLVQHSAGSGKSFTIAWLAHWLSVLHDDYDRRVFDTILVITDRRVLDRQLQETIRQFEQTLGVVETIDQDSAQLRQALESGKNIVVTTLQKFPVIVEKVSELPGKRFALIVDEAHSSQSGESTKALKAVLSVPADQNDEAALEAAEAEDQDEGDDVEDVIVAEMKTRQKLANASTFAFTATPKNKTLELFGRLRDDGKYEAHKLYSMRQAIEEDFIMDVLEHYTTYATYWRLLKTVEDDPRYDKTKAQSLLKRFVDLHPHAIGRKVEIMVEHFHEHVASRVAGQAKAMIVTRSRLHCVRYKLALDRYLKENGYPYRSLVAFSGTVRDGANDHTEAGMNRVPDSQTKALFERPEYRFLVVAEKFQTGFDQPLLHTMYVDKKLTGLNAVQTLSRLNRTHPDKEETVVLDFANEADQVQKAFAEYYETTLLSEGTDPNLLYDRHHELEEFGVFTENEVDEFAELCYRRRPQEKLLAYLDPIADRAREVLDEERLGEFRASLRDYVRLYAFLSQVISFIDADLEKLYVFAKLLRALIKSEAQPLPSEVQEMIDMDSLRIERTFKGQVDLPRGPGTVEPQSATSADRGKRPEELEPLSVIIEDLNSRFGAELGDEDKITLGRILDRAEQNDSLRLSVENNTEENARLAFESAASDLLQSLVETNFQLYKRIADNRPFHDSLMSSLFEQFRKRVLNGGYDETKVLEEIEAGETKHVEFKSTLRLNLHTERNDERMEHAALKTIAGFQNAEGGVLYLGVNDESEILGIEPDGFPNADKFLLHLNNIVKSRMGKPAAARIEAKVWDLDDHEVCRVICRPSPQPVFLKEKGDEKFYVRSGPSTEEMSPSETHSYIAERFRT